MDKKLKAKWVKALRSGKFKQCHDAYYNGKRGMHAAYCCLGVLDRIDQGSKVREWGASETKAGPSEQVKELIYLNDNEKKTFKEIADHIEKNL